MMGRRGRRGQRGQSLVEFTLILPTLLLLVLGTAEMGLALNTSMSLVEATREGARVGAALSNGASTIIGCASGSTNVDPQIIESVQRVVESPGNGIKRLNIDWIRIFKSDSGGNEVSTNEWRPTVSPGGGPSICGVALDFKLFGTENWPASSRSTTLPVVSLGVKIQYHYTLVTPLNAIFKVFGGGQITMTDQTVMALEP